MNSVSGIADNNVWAAGFYMSGGTYHTLVEHWDGGQWGVVSSPNQGTADNHLSSISAVSDQDIWAVGFYTSTGALRTLTEHWNGTEWSVVPSPNQGAADNHLSGVAAVSASDVWAIGDYQSGPYRYVQTLVEHWNGTEWSVVPSPNPDSTSASLTGVAAVSASDVWAVGSYNGRTLTEHWNGTEWSVVPSPNLDEDHGLSNNLYGVTAISPNDVWAVGNYGMTDAFGAVYDTLIEHWNGTEWSVISSPDPAPYNGDIHIPDVYNILYEVTAVSANDVWAVGGYAYNYDPSRTMLAHWNGMEWSVVPSSNVNTGYNFLYGVAATSASDVWAVGSYSYNVTDQPLVERQGRCPPATSTPTPIGTAIPTPTPRCPGEVFSDVCPGDYFYTAVVYLYNHGVISGYSDGTFRPYANTTRGQLCKIIVLAEGWGIDTWVVPTSPMCHPPIPSTNI